MDAFSLLRYWRSSGGSDTTSNANVTTSSTTTTIVTGISTQTSDTGSDDNDNDHGPFFDLELSLQNENDENDEDSDGSEDDIEDVNELKFALVSSSSGDSTTDDVTVSVSPSDDLFFKGGFVAVAADDDSGVQTTSFGGTHSSKPSPRASLLKSATKLRVMMLKLKKMKISENTSTTELKQQQQKDKQINIIEEVPIVSLFKRHNSTSKTQKKLQNDVVEPQQQQQQQTVSEDISVNAEEKKFSKETMQRYLRKVKPLYVRVSKRYGEKLKFSGQLAIKQKMSPSPVTSPAAEERKELSTVKEGNLEVSEPPLLSGNGKGLKQGNLPAGLRVVCKHLGKSRSASTAVVAAAPPCMMSKRRDDSLLQQQDGIQSAILHCKRSFKASRDSDCSSSESASAYGKCGNDSISDTAAEVRETTVEDEMKKS